MGIEINQRLQDLLQDLREELNIEIKGWLEGSDNDRAILAKALIALANHGGGFLVNGFVEEDLCYVPHKPRPTNLDFYGQDSINGIVSRYAEPPFHCNVYIIPHPNTQQNYPVIHVPAGRVPTRTKRASPDEKTLRNNVYYIRRPGPQSDLPQSGQEWENLIRRCIIMEKEQMFDGIRKILIGASFDQQKVSDEELLNWKTTCLSRWKDLTEKLSKDHMAKLKHGKYYYACEIISKIDMLSLVDFQNKLREIRGYTGWRPFHIPSGENRRPYKIDDVLECYLGGTASTPSTADFWRASPTGKMFLLRGYEEDGGDSFHEPPGTVFDITLPIWRVAEYLLYTMELAKSLGGEKETRIRFSFLWDGLVGRKLVTCRRLYLSENKIAHQPEFSYEGECSVDEIEKNLPEITHSITKRLLELFGLYQLPLNLVIKEIKRLKNR